MRRLLGIRCLLVALAVLAHGCSRSGSGDTPAGGSPRRSEPALPFLFVARDGAELWAASFTSTTAVASKVADFDGWGYGSLQAPPVSASGVWFFANGASLWRSDGTAGGTRVVLDGVQVDQLTRYRDLVFFSDYDPQGWKLWRSDGSVDGTTPIPGTSDLSWLIGVAGDKLFFVSGGALRVTDGSAAGTRMVIDNFYWFNGWPTLVGDFVYFIDESPYRLSRTDGTSAGTRMLRYLTRLPAGPIVDVSGSALYPDLDDVSGQAVFQRIDPDGAMTTVGRPDGVMRQATAVGDTLFFWNQVTPGAWQLWKLPFGARTAALVKPQSMWLRDPSHPQVALGNELWFVADDKVHGEELWRSDGTDAGTVLVTDLNPGAAGSEISKLSVYGDSVWFEANDGVNSFQLWRASATLAPTRVTDLPLTSQSSMPVAAAGVLVASSGDVFLVASDGINPKALYRIPPGGSPEYLTSRADYLAEAETGTIFFFGGADGNQLWKTDGTPGGTSRVKVMPPIDPGYLTACGSLVYFQAALSYGWEMWRSDGTDAGTYLLEDINPRGSSLSGYPNAGYPGVPVPGTSPCRILFLANDGTNQTQLWASEGTAASTWMVTHISTTTTGIESASLLAPDPASGHVYFNAKGYTYALWRTDGFSIEPLLLDAVASELLPLGNGISMFTENGSGLWRTDGTAGGTQLVNGNLRDVVSFRRGAPGVAFFYATDGVRGTGLWRTDGTASGTWMVSPADGVGPYHPSHPSMLAVAGDTAYFSRNDGVHGSELWKSDGSASGTVLVKDIVPGPFGSAISELRAIGATGVFFSACDERGCEPWRTDGTEAGTVRIADLNPPRPSMMLP
jgi:ELWxxDGT repeat protein